MIIFKKEKELEKFKSDSLKEIKKFFISLKITLSSDFVLELFVENFEQKIFIKQ